ncbi:phosphoprotein phosphatase 1, partial [Trichinella spiralis]|uniref:phosphoprotein phosphatase 1 n=1 Tax=Trichinella spiralis TaxID=6334 RepID=UPI0001EFBCF8
AGLISGKIFCMHGGLSKDLETFDQIRSIERPVEIPLQGLLADLLWSDPDRNINGWEISSRNVGYVFGEDVILEFYAAVGMGHYFVNAILYLYVCVRVFVCIARIAKRCSLESYSLIVVTCKSFTEVQATVYELVNFAMAQDKTVKASPSAYAGASLSSSCHLPLRMVVKAKFVGAIIGHAGSTIRDIAKVTKTRCVVDFSKDVKENRSANNPFYQNAERIISIFGNPDNASNACVKILQLVEREKGRDAEDTNNSQLELKIRVHNNLIGRLIGKNGATIKQIIQETGADIYVSKSFIIHEFNVFNMERTVTIRGTLEALRNGEKVVSAKLRQFWNADMSNRPETVCPMLSIPSVNLDSIPPIIHNQKTFNLLNYVYKGFVDQFVLIDAIRILLQSSDFEDVIGSNESNLRFLAFVTGAAVEAVRTSEKDAQAATKNLPVTSERVVVTTGTFMQNSKVLFLIYKQLCDKIQLPFHLGFLHLKISIPAGVIGRIIGKGGENIRNLRRASGAQLVLTKATETTDASLSVKGNFYAIQGCVEEELKAQKFESSIKNRNTILASLNEEISRQSARESLFRIFPDADLDAVDESELDRELFQMGVNVNDDIFELLDDEQKEEFQKIWRKYLKKNFASSVATESTKLFAIVKFGDEQFKVTEEDIIIVEGSYPFKVGDKIRLEKILCVGSSDFTLFGTPVLP